MQQSRRTLLSTYLVVKLHMCFLVHCCDNVHCNCVVLCLSCLKCLPSGCTWSILNVLWCQNLWCQIFLFLFFLFPLCQVRSATACNKPVLKPEEACISPAGLKGAQFSINAPPECKACPSLIIFFGLSVLDSLLWVVQQRFATYFWTVLKFGLTSYGLTASQVVRLIGLLLVFTSQKKSIMSEREWQSLLCRWERKARTVWLGKACEI